MPLFLGLDLGTSGLKALLVNESGAKIAAATEEYPLLTPRPQWAEQHPQDWWEACVQATRAVLSKANITGADIAGIGLSGQMHGSVFLDAQGEVLRPALLWCDQRTQAECDYLTAQADGHLPEWIGNPVLTGFTAPKIVWLRNHEPDTYARVAKVLLPKDYLRYKLTGAFAGEVSDASGTALFDVARRQWSQPMLDAAGIPRAWMPDVSESPDITARISPEAAQQTGLAAGTPVAGGGGDQAAGAVGSGIVEAGIVSSTVGTSGVVFAYSAAAVVDPHLRAHTFCHAVPGAWHLMGVSLSSGGSLRWLRDTFFQPEGVVGRTTGVDPYDYMAAGADTVPPGSEGLLFLPYLTGERTPYPDANARGVFFGITLRHHRQHFARAVLEGVAYSLNDTFRIFHDLGVPVREVRASGGGAKSAVWRQIHADVTGYAHHTLATDEGPALGAAILAMVGTGQYATVADACAACVRTVDVTQPDAAAHAVYEKQGEVYRALYPALKAPFAAITEAAQ